MIRSHPYLGIMFSGETDKNSLSLYSIPCWRSLDTYIINHVVAAYFDFRNVRNCTISLEILYKELKTPCANAESFCIISEHLTLATFHPERS